MTRNAVLGDVYVDACMAYGKVPNQAGLDAWKGVLGEYQPQEVMRALRVWQGNDEIDDFTKRTRGAVMPAPSELKALGFVRGAKKDALNIAANVATAL